jgi:hypothetical protein
VQKTIILGDEYDRRLQRRLNEVLRSMGAEIGASTWGVAGSQELSTWEAAVEGRTLKIESETYIGLSISGEGALVERVVASLKALDR